MWPGGWVYLEILSSRNVPVEPLLLLCLVGVLECGEGVILGSLSTERLWRGPPPPLVQRPWSSLASSSEYFRIVHTLSRSAVEKADTSGESSG